MLRSTRTRLLIGSCTFLAIGVLLVALAWWRLPDLLNIAAAKALPELGLNDARLSVTDAGAERLVIQSGLAVGEGWRATLDRLEANYSWRGLWRERRMARIRLEGVQVEVIWPEVRDGLSPIEESPTAASPEFDLAWIDQLPAEKIEVTGSSLAFESEDARGVIGWSGVVWRRGDGVADVRLKFSSGDAAVTIAGALVRGGTSELRIVGNVPDALSLISATVPEWRHLVGLPEPIEVAMGLVSFHGQAVVTPDSASVEFDQIKAGDVAVRIDDRVVRFDAVTATLNVEMPDAVRGTVDIAVRQAEVGAVSLPKQVVRLDFTNDGLARWKVATGEAVSWDYDEGTIAARTRAALGLNLEQTEAGMGIEAAVEVLELELAGETLGPLQIQAAGDLATLDFRVSPLFLRESPGLRMESIHGSLHASEANTVQVGVRGAIGPQASAFFIPGLEMRVIEFEVDSMISEQSVEIVLAVDPRAGDGHLLDLPGRLTLDGEFSFNATGRMDTMRNTWSGAWQMEGNGLHAGSPDWSAEGMSFAADCAFAETTIPELESASMDPGALASTIFRAAEGRIDWQADRISTEVFETQWLSGNVELGVTPASREPIGVKFEASAGSAHVLGESLQQVTLAVAAEGNPGVLESTGVVTYFYAGNEGGIEFQLEASDLLGSPSGRGEYRLKPLTFDYSDVLGRHLPSFNGISFSGVLAGSGSYWFDREGADASLRVRFSDGSVSYPASQITASGIHAQVAIASLIELTGEPGESVVEVAQVQAGDLVAANGRLAFDLRGDTVALREARIETFGGRVALEPATITLEPLAFDGIIAFERLALGEISRQMEFFKGEMEGVVSGQLPFVFANDVFALREGELTLPPGETAKLHYDARGLFAKPDQGEASQAPTLGNRLMGYFQLDPETLVEEALSDLTITRMRVDLFRKETPLTPLRIQLSGEAVSGEIKVPLHLETNINGTTGELYNFLIRLNSLGSASF